MTARVARVVRGAVHAVSGGVAPVGGGAGAGAQVRAAAVQVGGPGPRIKHRVGVGHLGSVAAVER